MKQRSPFHGMTRQEIAALRLLVSAQNDWKRRLGTPEQSLEPGIPYQVFAVLSWQIRLRAQDQLHDWWRKQPDYETTHAVFEDQAAHRSRPELWEMHQLRGEVAQLRAVAEEIQQMMLMKKVETTWES